MSVPKLTENKAIDWISRGEWQKGRPYAEDGSLDHLRMQGMSLKAECWGTASTPYRVKITFNKDGIKDAQCSCPVSYGCKHIAALLYAWVHQPNTFTKANKLDDILHSQEKTELIELIKKMIDKHPDLERIIELQNVMDKPLTESVIRKQVKGMLKSLRYNRRDSYRSHYDDYGQDFDEIEELVEKAESYLTEPHLSLGKHRDASIIFKVVSEEMLADYDENGYTDAEDLPQRCGVGLAECLSVAQSSKDRMYNLKAMFALYTWDVSFGGIDIGYNVPEAIMTYANEEERNEVYGWVKSAIADLGNRHSDWGKKAYGALLLQLQPEISDDKFIEICIETGRFHDAIQKLLELKRKEEAIKMVKSLKSRSLLDAVKLLIKFGHAKEGIDIIEKAHLKDPSRFYRDWLMDYETQNGNYTKVLEYTLETFEGYKTLTHYKDLERIAKLAKSWDSLKKSLINRLKQDQDLELLCEIHLYENDIDAAIDNYQDLLISPKKRFHIRKDLTLNLAKKTKNAYPSESIKLYKELLEQILDSRNRSEYATAVEYLKIVKAIYSKKGEQDQWQFYYKAVLKTTKQLRAFKQERERLGLLD